MFNDIITILNKELARVFTDRKLVFTTFVLPALSLVLIYSVMGLMIQKTSNDRNEHISQIAVIDAPASFATFFANKEQHFNVKLTLENNSNERALKDAIYNGKLDALVVFDQGFDDKILTYQGDAKMPNVNSYYNPTEDYSSAAYQKVANRILVEYEKYLLINRFGSEKFLSAFTIDLGNEENQLAPPEKISGDFLGGLVPFLLSIFLFSGGMGIGIDLITGEKERGTMATMLVTPIKREAIAFGKMLSLGVVSLLSTASSIVGMVIAYPFLMMVFGGGSEEAGGIGPQISIISPVGVLQFMILAVFLTLMYVGIICVISVYANSMKEAGTLITPAYMAVMVLGVVTMFSNSLPAAWVFATPVYGTLMGMKHALSAELTWGMFGLNILVSTTFVIAIIWVIRQMFNSEKIMFGA